MTDTGSDIRRSALHGEHLALGADMDVIGGWEVPLHYRSELDEHRAVREAVGVFDLSQMGEIRVSGPDAPSFLAHSLISAMKPIALGKAKYTMIVQEDGGIIDDLIAYRLGVDEFMLVQNAGNCDDVLRTLEERVGGYDVRLDDRSVDTALIAVQGPRAEELLIRVAPDEAERTVRDLRYYSCTSLEIAGVESIIARTGYTGEDGFEIFAPMDRSVEVWRALLARGESLGVLPCGLDCRDTLRLEAGMPLYGKELTRSRTPLEAGFASLISPAKGRFIGRNALVNQPEPARILVGLEIVGAAAPADGAALADGEGAEVGEVTSAAVSPTLHRVIAMGYVDKRCALAGTELSVTVDGEPRAATVAPMPFYNRKKQ